MKSKYPVFSDLVKEIDRLHGHTYLEFGEQEPSNDKAETIEGEIIESHSEQAKS